MLAGVIVRAGGGALRDLPAAKLLGETLRRIEDQGVFQIAEELEVDALFLGDMEIDVCLREGRRRAERERCG